MTLGLQGDLVVDGTWHDGYDSATGGGLAAKGFLSWDTLGATWQDNLEHRIDPFDIHVDEY